MRLIDADQIVNYRVTLSNGQRYVLLPVEKLGDIPTAYDVDKVIEKLSERIERVDEFDSYKNGKLTICERRMIPSQLVIKIVERGGIDDR